MGIETQRHILERQRRNLNSSIRTFSSAIRIIASLSHEPDTYNKFAQRLKEKIPKLEEKKLEVLIAQLRIDMAEYPIPDKPKFYTMYKRARKLERRARKIKEKSERKITALIWDGRPLPEEMTPNSPEPSNGSRPQEDAQVASGTDNIIIFDASKTKKTEITKQPKLKKEKAKKPKKINKKAPLAVEFEGEILSLTPKQAIVFEKLRSGESLTKFQLLKLLPELKGAKSITSAVSGINKKIAKLGSKSFIGARDSRDQTVYQLKTGKK
ncbi:hypothetical protein C4559_03680 [Candidatus Microgenomates bacterium]|nr:MAG: hypothetical protein C4559_03680 [Candidatus Microgenomates bacterium]